MEAAQKKEISVSEYLQNNTSFSGNKLEENLTEIRKNKKFS